MGRTLRFDRGFANDRNRRKRGVQAGEGEPPSGVVQPTLSCCMSRDAFAP
jgi:hypothetical protein